MVNEIPIFFTVDDGYAPFLGVALSSLIRCSDPARRYRAVILHQGLSPAYAQKLQALEREHFRVELTELRRQFDTIRDIEENRLRCDYFTLTIFFRLFIPNLYPQYDKAVYVDSDVVLRGDIANLYEIDLEDNLVGACHDRSIETEPRLIRYTEEAVGVKFEEYVNSGVLLLNLAALRREKFEERFLSLLETYHFDTVAPDQDYLNAICNGKIRYLPSIWDTMPVAGQAENPDARLIHYNLFEKPWFRDGVPYETYFWEAAAHSGFADEIKTFKKEYEPHARAKEAECLTSLLSRADAICEKPVTFKKAAESGVRIRI